MTRIESDKTIVNKSPEAVFNFLSNFNNFQKLMPEQVTNWQSTEDECSFTIAGMASLGMKITEKKPNSFILVSKNGSAPFDFTLECMLSEKNSSQQSRSGTASSSAGDLEDTATARARRRGSS